MFFTLFFVPGKNEFPPCESNWRCRCVGLENPCGTLQYSETSTVIYVYIIVNSQKVTLAQWTSGSGDGDPERDRILCSAARSFILKRWTEDNKLSVLNCKYLFGHPPIKARIHQQPEGCQDARVSQPGGTAL